ncbi:MAG: hypothetical protein ACREVX_01180 [Clostridium sp.]|uniref:hypothetical protein n=1 Tax=Clostridium sp. TaxID=1506 RepID=UPI003D6D10A2
MSNWIIYDCENRIREILLRSEYKKEPGHHLGKPFLSPYQIAIEYDKTFHNDVLSMGYVVGGKGVNTKTSLAQYIGRELSKRIKNITITDIEGGFFSNKDLEEISFNHGNIIISSATGGIQDLSIFRIKSSSI